MTKLVMDASITMCWCFKDQTSNYTEKLLNDLAGDTEAHVPAIWAYEVTNTLVMAQRRKRMTQAQAIRFWEELQALPILVQDRRLEPLCMEMMALAGQYQLTAYDAAYLELALREGLPMATLDEPLRAAAQAAGVPLFA